MESKVDLCLNDLTNIFHGSSSAIAFLLNLSPKSIVTTSAMTAFLVTLCFCLSYTGNLWLVTCDLVDRKLWPLSFAMVLQFDGYALRRKQ